ncbi:MAG: UbiX family flavin prenyltransferase [Candidatus Altiarchaeota archaeon]
MKVVVGVTGASGIVLADKLLDNLKGQETFLIISEAAKKVGKYEGYPSVEPLEKKASHSYRQNNLAAPISSSSFPVDAMVIVPCSMKTLSACANGYADDLIVRAAENMLKMGKKLVVCPRETPLSLSALKNMAELKTAGAIILPPNLAFYPRPESVEDVIGFFVGKILDSLSIEHNLYKKWGKK